MEDNIYYRGTVKIKNPKTLQKWINKGWYQEEIEGGNVFNVGCGRFREEKCTCFKCRKSTNSALLKVLEENNLL